MEMRRSGKIIVLAVFFLLTCSFLSQAAENSITWLLSGPDIVVTSNQFETLPSTDDCWTGQIISAGDPFITLKTVDIDANKYKYLCLKITTASASSLQIFFDRQGFNEQDSFRCYQCEPGSDPVTYVFDLRKIENWKSGIAQIRVDFDGTSENDIIKVCSLGVSEKPVTSGQNLSYVVPQLSNSKRERMAAHQDTMMMTSETVPNTGVITYQSNFNRYLISKIITAIEIDGKEVSSSAADNIHVDDFPGGVQANFSINDIKVTTRQMPLIIGRDTDEQDGAVLFQISTEPAVPVIVHCGPGKLVVPPDWGGAEEAIRSSNFKYAGDFEIELNNNLALIKTDQVPFYAVVKAKGQMNTDKDGPYGPNVAIRFEAGKGQVMIAFAPDNKRAAEIANLNLDNQYGIFKEYYAKLMESAIETPDPSINEAFQTAIYNLKYNWLKPYGWIECIHHWTAVWHQQHTAGVEWLGQADRSRLCIETQAIKSEETDGHIPNIFPNGTPFVSFGGTNQFWTWELRHYWKYTADKEFAAEMAPVLDKVLEVTWEKYDPERNLLLCWGQQIGNQEDYVDTPHNGTSPTISGINMMRTRSELAQALGDTKTVLEMNTKIELAKSRLRKELWKNDLGRYVFYKDPLKNLYLDGQYHSIIYPVIYGITDRFDSWTSIRHLRDRLMGADGEVYCSNNFPNHVSCTCGPQAGAAQQPWGAWGLSAMGLRNETYRPLKAVADWVNSPVLRGSWPEVDGEDNTPAYFSPPVGLFVASTVEALFGLKTNTPAGILEVSPSFPDSWPNAKLKLPDFSADYKRNGNSLEYTVTSNQPLTRNVRWLLPPCSVTDVRVDGKKVKYEVTPDVGSVLLTFETEKSTSTKLTFDIAPLEYSIDYPKSIAQGDVINLKAKDCSFVNLDDRCGVLKYSDIKPSKITAKIQESLLDPYLGFGRLGLMNFSRRTFFVECTDGKGIRFWQPIDITILPRYEASSVTQLTKNASGANAELLVRNNTFDILQGVAWLKTARTQIPVDISIPSRSEKNINCTIANDRLALLSTGDNTASLILPDGETLDVKLDASALYKEIPTLSKALQARTHMLDLPEKDLVDDARWSEFRNFYAYNHPPWANTVPALQALKAGVYQDDKLPVTFKIPNRKLIPVSTGFDPPSYTLSLNG